MARLVCIARIGAAHGVQGAVRLWTFTRDPLAVKDYGPLLTAEGDRSFELTALREGRGFLVVNFKGITTREAAERLNGTELHVGRDRLPATGEEEYYHTDLIGLSAVTTRNEPIGRVVAVHNFGAGDILEIAPSHGPSLLLPFTDPVVPEVDLASGRVVINPGDAIAGKAPAP
ncbi:MAG: ribosome maturation factor RimM [Alphaproteobacteria bacterium]|nr:ribosome maturation factor RimM [Alphaproteobacteria bacterium]